MNYTIKQERISDKAYIDFLKTSDLGHQYPHERFKERIAKLVTNADISLTARNESNEIIGVLLGLSDFAYYLFVTDLGVSRDWINQGIGKQLMEKALTICGGSHDISVTLIANDKAIGFYEKIGMHKANDMMVYSEVDWTPFIVK